MYFDLGAFNNGFQGICGVFVTAAFSFAGTELAGLAAAETVFPVSCVSDDRQIPENPSHVHANKSFGV